MASKWQFTKERFSKDFEILRVPKLFEKKVGSRLQIALREVLGARPELQVDLSFNYWELDSKKQETYLKEIKKVGNDFRALEKRWEKNRKRGLPRWAGFEPDEIFISSDQFEVLFQPKPTTTTSKDDFRYCKYFTNMAITFYLQFTLSHLFR